MISSQRLLMIIIAINLFIGFAITIYQNPFEVDNNELTTMNDFLEQSETVINSESGIWGNVKSEVNRVSETTLGNTIKMILFPFKVLINGINPLSVRPTQFTNLLEIQLAYMIVMIRSLMMFLGGLEAYLLIKNKKSS